ncbi:MAG: GGDEF domain-containing protein [Candidatus Nealsonbacteria bacterium]|nr:GGDEF domain-containing protein [Candidatus Nealsonbacteria bacterium]
MPLFLIDIAFGVVMASVGVGAGIWLRGRTASRKAAMVPNDAEYAKEALASLHVLAHRVAAHVGEHNTRVEEINEELSSRDTEDPEAVIDAVNRLIDANDNMQRQLGDAEVKLEEQARLVESHAEQARTDALTGLANRRAFDDEMARRLSEFQRNNLPFALAMLDVDKFKNFNDTHGHQAGDEVLKGIADVLRKESRGMDLVARYGGEEMAIVLGAASLDEATASGERFCRAIEKARFQHGDTEMRVTASFGVAQVLDADDVEALIERADAAMYASKEGGRNCVHSHDGDAIRAFGAEEPSEVADLPAEVPVDEPQPPQALAEDLVKFSDSLNHRLAEYKRGGRAPSVLLVKIDDFSGIQSRYKPSNSRWQP